MVVGGVVLVGVVDRTAAGQHRHVKASEGGGGCGCGLRRDGS